jgi:carboxypeptidase Taq
MTTPFDALLTYQRQSEALGRIAQRLGWDHETVMPVASGDDRSEEMAALEGVMHARGSGGELGDLLSAVDPDQLAGAERRMFDLIQTDFNRRQKVPQDLAVALARITSKSHRAWTEAKAADDVLVFLPMLNEVVNLARQKAEALADDNTSLYDALLQDFEPDGSSAEITQIFDTLRPHLVDLRAEVLERNQSVSLSGHFPQEQQRALTQRVARVFGYDMDRGRIDVAVHPFSSGGGNDVRITTRYDETNPLDSLYSTIHEVGHATYEQNVDQAYNFTPLGNGCSMAVHESQSRIYENQLARSRPFTDWLFGQMKDSFDDLGVADSDAFYRAVNSVKNGFIRTEADELQYNLHIMLRYDLERALISGDLMVNDLEAAWNDRFLTDFGYAVPKASLGMLQDIHWSECLIGYFPTYAIGNIYAACLREAMLKDAPNAIDELSEGRTDTARNWLQENVQRHGCRYKAQELIEKATGEAASSEPFVRYIREKFATL